MTFPVKVGIQYSGGVSDQALVDVYDYSKAIYGFARTAAILSEYYSTSKIISRAPSASVDFYVEAAEEGSFKQAIAAGAFAGIISAPFAPFFTRVLDSWLPTPDPVAERQLAEQIKTNELLEKLLTEEQPATVRQTAEETEIDSLLKEKEPEFNVLRSILSGSFADVFRPIERGGSRYARIFGESDGAPKPPSKLITPITVRLIESERVDEEIRTINARVTGFTRGSKTGYCSSEKLGHGFRFEYKGEEDNLPARDIFSWSQYEQKEIIMEGQFVYYFDGKIKKFIVYFAQQASTKANDET